MSADIIDGRPWFELARMRADRQRMPRDSIYAAEVAVLARVWPEYAPTYDGSALFVEGFLSPEAKAAFESVTTFTARPSVPSDT